MRASSTGQSNPRDSDTGGCTSAWSIKSAPPPVETVGSEVFQGVWRQMMGMASDQVRNHSTVTHRCLLVIFPAYIPFDFMIGLCLHSSVVKRMLQLLMLYTHAENDSGNSSDPFGAAAAAVGRRKRAARNAHRIDPG